MPLNGVLSLYDLAWDPGWEITYEGGPFPFILAPSHQPSSIAPQSVLLSGLNLFFLVELYEYRPRVS